MRFAEEFKDFMGRTKSEMLFVREAVKLAESGGFRPWSSSVGPADVAPGSRWYRINRDRTLVLFVIGSEPIENGLRIVNTRIDSVRMEFKTKPFRERHEMVVVDTQVHGGLKNYQWTNIPLAIVGRVDKSNGTAVWIETGNRLEDPIFIIPDLAPHVDHDFRDRKQRDVVRTEELEPIIGSMPPEPGSEPSTATAHVLSLLEREYGIEPKDFLSADLHIVPALAPSDVGMDRGLVAAYGQDDRATAYVSLRSIMEVEVPRYTAMAYAVNNEEVSSWNTGVSSEWFNLLVAEVLAMQNQDEFSELMLRRAYSNAEVLVSDCTTALNPVFPQPQNLTLSSRLGYGLVVKEYGPGRKANSEFFARMRDLFDAHGIHWQTHSYDSGYGGRTIAAWFAGQNMEVIDVGIGILSMHSPYEVSSKADFWHLHRAFQVFFGN